jgi:hypothetical protein
MSQSGAPERELEAVVCILTQVLVQPGNLPLASSFGKVYGEDPVLNLTMPVSLTPVF